MKIHSTLQRILLPIALIAILGPLLLAQREFSQKLESVDTDAQRQADSLVRLLSVSEQLMMERVVASMRLLRNTSEQRFGFPGFDGSTLLAGIDGSITLNGRQLHNLTLGGIPQTNRSELVDSVTSVMGGTATLFVKDGPDFIRIATNVVSADGSRAIGTPLDPHGMAIGSLRDGHPFYGVVDILGTPYITGYEPMRNSQGNMIGAWYVGFKIDTQALREAVEKTRILNSGFAAVLDANRQIRFRSMHVKEQQVEKLLASADPGWNIVHRTIPEWRFEVVVAYPVAEARTLHLPSFFSSFSIFIFLGALLTGLVFFMMRHFVLKPLGGDPELARELVSSISAGHLEDDGTHAADGTLMGNMLMMRRNLRAMVNTLHANSEKLGLSAMVFDHAHDAILITDAQGRIIEANPAFSRTTGYERHEVYGRFAQELLAPRDEEDRFAAVWAALKQKGAWRGETQLAGKDGKAFAAWLDLFAVKDEQQRVNRFVGVFSDITHVVEHQQKLAHMAYHDPLTQLPNRALFSDRLEHALARIERSDEILGVCYFDLDGFKPINDNMGHDAGDQLLIQLAQRLRTSLRAGDTIARLGGDEFAILLCELETQEECCQTLERLLAIIAAPYLINGKPVEVSASAGLTLSPPDEANPDLLLRHADQAMYQAKLGGKNTYHMFDPEHDRQTRTRHEIVDAVQIALDQGEFRLYYQPKVNMRQGKVIGFEALIRWQHPELGLRPPMEFLPVVENHDISVGIGEWVMREALRQMQAWRALDIHLPVSVNINARHLMKPNFIQRLADILGEFPSLPSSMLELEITESASLEDFASVSALIEECRSLLGVTFALDDFGAGYSSLTYLRRLPADVVKIDQSFVRDMLRDPEDLAIVSGVLSLAREFNRKVVAEGVETAEHGVKLLAMNCEIAQGYGIAKPMPAESVPDWLKAYAPDPTWISPYASLTLVRKSS